MSKTFLEALTSVGKNLQSGVDKLKETSVDYINVKQAGAVGDGITDDSAVILAQTKDMYFDAYTFLCTPLSFINSSPAYSKMHGTGKMKFSITQNDASGICEISKINNPIYRFMHLPSECRNAAHTLDFPVVTPSTWWSFSGENIYANCMGGIQTIEGKTVPNNFTLCIGKCYLLGYKNGKWYKMVEMFPRAALHRSDWTGDAIDITGYKTEYSDHVEYALTTELWNADNADHLLHFYTDSYCCEKDGDLNTDYKYLMTVASAWIKETGNDDTFRVNIACDYRKTKGGKTDEAGGGRCMKLTSQEQKLYWYTVADADFDTVIGDSFDVNNISAYAPDAHIELKNRYSVSYKLALPPVRDATRRALLLGKIPTSLSPIIISNILIYQPTSSTVIGGEFLLRASSSEKYVFTKKSYTAVANMIFIRSDDSYYYIYTLSTAWQQWQPIFVEIEAYIYTTDIYAPISVEHPEELENMNFNFAYSSAMFNKYWIEDTAVDGDTGNIIS